MAPRLLSVLAALCLAACFETPKPACIFLCGEGGVCPSGYECGSDDNRCHRVDSGGELAECPDELPSIDAAIDGTGTPIDAPGADAQVDSMTDSMVCAPALNPTSDGGPAGSQDLVLSEINPGDYIEVYNNTASPIVLDSTTYQLFSDPNSVAIDTAGVGAGITVAAHGYAQLGWPAAFTDTDAGGEVILFADDQFTTATSIMDFVCWGTNPHDSSKALAETAGKWGASGACAGALTMSAIHRLVATAGTAASDYSTVLPASPMTCAP